MLSTQETRVGPIMDKFWTNNGQIRFYLTSDRPYGASAAGTGKSASGSASSGRGLHSSASRFNLSAFCGIGVAFRGSLRGV